MDIIQLKTDRLVLRQWKASDLSIFAELNASPTVMKYYPSTLNKKESNEMADKISKLISSRGWGFWAVERKDIKEFIGFVGLHEPSYDLPCTPCTEIGWRLSNKHWGKGYATEAAIKSLEFAFTHLDLPEVYSFTSVANTNSEAVMKRIGMQNLHKNFEHPIIPEGNDLREHLLYRLSKNRFNIN